VMAEDRSFLLEDQGRFKKAELLQPGML